MELTKETCTEAYSILNMMSEQLRSKIPDNFYSYIDNNRDKENYFEISDLNEYKPSEQATLLYAALYRKFFASEEEKKYFQEKEIELAQKNDELARKKYNPDDIFKNNVKVDEKIIDEEEYPEENNCLTVSEKRKKVFLPYSKVEIDRYLEQFPDSYRDYADVIRKEFVLPLEIYSRYPTMARFREAYALIKDREAKSFPEALRFAISVTFQSNLNPAIIAGCKTQEQLENYLDCLEKNDLSLFKDFEIKFEVNPFISRN